MINKLEIKYRNQKQSFEILDEEIRVDLSTAKHKLKYNIPLEDIENSWFIEKGSLDKTTVRLYTSLFLNLFLILCLVVLFNKAPPLAFKILCSFLFLPFIFMIIKNTEECEEKHLRSSKHLYFIYTKKNAAEVDAFIELVYQKQIEFFRKKYFLIDPVLPHNLQYERYIWLYSNKYINENEYEVIKEDLDRYFNFNPNII
ncbi:hypothetical protein [Flavobacterium sp. W20_MBD1_R3]|uniref:hypothetical protein n=1 Tax=Flavobacterium sp. W20_MBD1_R3 TaxID=3240278 RepID=UPI003F8F4B7A